MKVQQAFSGLKLTARIKSMASEAREANSVTLLHFLLGTSPVGDRVVQEDSLSLKEFLINTLGTMSASALEG